jgi:hypothetical protein
MLEPAMRTFAWLGALALVWSCSGKTTDGEIDALCRSCETDQDCAALGADHRCVESGVTQRCSVDCALVGCPSGFECNLGSGGFSGSSGAPGTTGSCSPIAGTCGPPPTACEKIASQIREHAKDDGTLPADRRMNPCADPVPPGYVDVCQVLRDKCAGGCADLC